MASSASARPVASARRATGQRPVGGDILGERRPGDVLGDQIRRRGSRLRGDDGGGAVSADAATCSDLGGEAAAELGVGGQLRPEEIRQDDAFARLETDSKTEQH